MNGKPQPTTNHHDKAAVYSNPEVARAAASDLNRDLRRKTENHRWGIERCGVCELFHVTSSKGFYLARPEL